jgi:translocon-associated protein subunit beta
MMNTKALAALVLVASGLCTANKAKPAKAVLLVSKELTNAEVVHGKEIVLKYSIHNVGNGPATAIQLTDDDVSRGQFDIKHGFKDGAKLKELKPGAKVMHSLIISPIPSICAPLPPGVFCKFNFTVAKAAYKAHPDDLSQQISYSSVPPTVEIWPGSEFSRQNAPHLSEWSVFVAICLIPLGYPYFRLSSVKQKYA